MRYTILVISLTLSSVFAQPQEIQIQLVPGWNQISINVIPPDDMFVQGRAGPDVPRMFNRVRDPFGELLTVMVVDGMGRFYYPAFNFNNIPFWNLQRGLWVLVEEPVPVESNHALKQVREKTNAKISVGERLFTRWEFINVFENELADFIMPDVTWTGGISELKKIATLAESYYIPISPHDASGPINVMAGAQVMMTVPNFYKLETSRYDLSNYNSFIDEPLDIRKGDLYIPERPGLGVNLDPEALKKYAIEGFDG